jgi:hypothetical protein
MGFLRTLWKEMRLIGSGPRRLAMVVFVICGFIELGAFGADVLLDSLIEKRFLPSPVVKSQFVALNLDFKRLGPPAPKPPLERLMDVANSFSGKTLVPYVFGGGQLGSPKKCSECSDCIRRRRLPANSSMDRFNQCSACRECGLDCSNFISHMFRQSGLKSKFATTATLSRENERVLWEKYAFINVGDDLLEARPGDLILKKGHVVMLLDIHPALGTIDFIHASRGSKRTPVGGIELRRGFSIKKAQRETIRILRHKDLVDPTDSTIVSLTKMRHLLTDLRRRMAAI